MSRALRVHRQSFSLIAAAASWGTATAISKRAVDEIQPLTLLPIELPSASPSSPSPSSPPASESAGHRNIVGSGSLESSTPACPTR